MTTPQSADTLPAALRALVVKFIAQDDGELPGTVSELAMAAFYAAIDAAASPVAHACASYAVSSTVGWSGTRCRRVLDRWVTVTGAEMRR